MMNFPMTSNTKKIIAEAVSFAKRYNLNAVGTEAILYGMAANPNCIAGKLLASYSVTRESVVAALSRLKINHTNPTFDFSKNASLAIKTAIEVMGRQGESGVTSEQLLYGIVTNNKCSASILLSRVLNIPLNYILVQLRSILGTFETAPQANNIDNSSKYKNMFNTSYEDFDGFGNRSGYQAYVVAKPVKNQKNTAQEQPQTLNSSLPEELLDMGVDMTAKVKSSSPDPIIGRDEETERVIEILCRKTKNNPCLIGEAGVGKSAVVEGLAQRIVKGNVPAEMKGKTIFSLDMGSLMAGTKYRGSMEEKLKGLISVISSRKDVIVFIDEIHMLAQAGSKDGEISPADMLKPYLARGEFQTIGATTNDEYRKFIEKDKALERRFQPVTVNEPTEDDCKKILRGIRPSFEKFHSVKIEDGAIDAAVELSVRYIMDRFLPDKAIDLIDEASAKKKVGANAGNPQIDRLNRELEEILALKEKARDNEEFIKAEEYKKQAEDIKAEIYQLTQEADSGAKGSSLPVVTSEDIATVVSKWIKIPVSKLTESEREKLLSLEKILHKRVIGQNEAVEAVSSAIRRARAGLKDPKRPIGSFIFLGPTGVGKTELTKALAEAMFDDENTVIRLDMSEFMESHSVAKLIGAPPGYVGHDDGGQLTEQVRRKPYSVVLFDEIEKAHPDVFNILLQMLDDGRLTDSQGRTVSFKNTVIILTSNVGVSTLPKAGSTTLGFGEEKDQNVDQKEHLLKALKNAFKPELLNRIDKTIIFTKLEKADIIKIANLMIDKLNKKLLSKGITLKFTKGAMQNIFEKGYDSEYGARPLRRYIEQNIEDGLAGEILSGKIGDGDSVVVSFKNNKFVFTKQANA